MQDSVLKMTNWFCLNKLSINTANCELINFGIGSPDQVTLLNYKTTYVVKKLNKFCGLMQRVRNVYSTKHLLLLYNSHAKSTILYGFLVCGRVAKTNLEPVEKCQKRIFRTFFFQNESKTGVLNFNCIENRNCFRI